MGEIVVLTTAFLIAAVLAVALLYGMVYLIGILGMWALTRGR